MASNRRAVFREYIRDFNPTRVPFASGQKEVYVPHPLATSTRLAQRLEIDPSSSHLLVGGTGSGKTTEILKAKAILDAAGDVQTVFLDVPAVQKASVLSEGVLVALAYRAIVDALRESKHGALDLVSVKSAIEQGDSLAFGYSYPDTTFPEEEGYPEVHVPGILTPPDENKPVSTLVSVLCEIVAAANQQYVMFFDGLDRVRAEEKIVKMILGDVAVLGQAGIGAVIVGPQDIRFGLHKHLLDRFTAVHLHGATNPRSGDAGFLDQVLCKRAPDALLPVEARQRLAHYSGGILRDLISLARDAGEAAYGAGAESIGVEHVELAADRYGRTLLLGITPELARQLLKLKAPPKILMGGVSPRFDPEVAFVAATPEDIELLLQRLVIEVPATPVRYFIHPTVVPHIETLRRSVRA